MAETWGWSMTPSLACVMGATLLGACVASQGCAGPEVPEGHERVEIAGRTFVLELAADEAKRTLGLGGRDFIPENGGMLFSFPDSRIRQFVMRDCLVPIDIIYLDADGRIVSMHHMPVEEPRSADETAIDYEMRLKRYSSRFNARYAIEIRGGLLEELDLQVGERIRLDTERLAEITR